MTLGAEANYRASRPLLALEDRMKSAAAHWGPSFLYLTRIGKPQDPGLRGAGKREQEPRFCLHCDQDACSLHVLPHVPCPQHPDGKYIAKVNRAGIS